METIRGIDEIDPEKYLAVLKEVPQMEQLAKAGLPLLVKECVANYYPFKEYFKNHGTGTVSYTHLRNRNTHTVPRAVIPRRTRRGI